MSCLKSVQSNFRYDTTSECNWRGCGITRIPIIRFHDCSLLGSAHLCLFVTFFPCSSGYVRF